MGVAMVFTERLASLAGGPPATPSLEPKRTTPPRHDEMRWIQAHANELAALDGQWISVEGARLIASGARLVDVVARAEAMGIHNPFVHRVEAERPVVPGADRAAVVDVSAREVSAGMGTGVVDDEDLVAFDEDGELKAVDLDVFSLSRFELVQFT